MTKLLREMYLNLSDSLKDGVGEVQRAQNHQKQLCFYRQIYEHEIDAAQKESLLVAARCLISISRFICENAHRAQSLDFARQQLAQVGDVFEGTGTRSREAIRQVTSKRIALLSQNNCDELSDAFLFLYMSLLQL